MMSALCPGCHTSSVREQHSNIQHSSELGTWKVHRCNEGKQSETRLGKVGEVRLVIVCVVSLLQGQHLLLKVGRRWIVLANLPIVELSEEQDANNGVYEHK